MPLMERNVLILRDIPTSTKKAEILSIFDNTECSVPSEVHSDIGNNWFCSFQTEEECLSTAKYLQQFGTFNSTKLHVRVKAIHDVKKADASPSMTSGAVASTKAAKVDSAAQPPLYSPGGYYANYGAYYGGAAAMDPYFAPYAAEKVVDAKEAIATEKVVEDRTAISDYPGVFDKYSQETFLKIFSEMKTDALLIPQSMRGRDFRIISEDVLVPILIASDAEEKEETKNKKRRKKNKRRKRRKEVSGTYYEDDMYDEYGNGYYAENGYDDGYYFEDKRNYYASQQRGGRGGFYEADGGYYEQENVRRRNRRKGGGRSQKQEVARKYNSRRNGQSAKTKSVKKWTQKGVKKEVKKSEKVSKPKVQK